MHRGRRDGRGLQGPRWLVDAYGRDEIIAPSYHGDDVTIAALPVAEGAAQGADLNLQVRLFDERLWPRASHQLFLADHFAATLDQSDENVEGAIAEPHRIVALQQQPLRRKEPERAKRG